MTRQLFRLYLFLLVCFSISVTATAQTVDIPDPNLRAAIEAELGKAPGDTITPDQMATLTQLEARHVNIRVLTGLEHATNLTFLGLYDNSIADISPLAGLTNLTSLSLWDNSISDISPLAGLTQLTTLELVHNSISDISPLAGLTQLTTLNLVDNSISDISPLARLTQLTTLNLVDNSISDLSPLVTNAGLGAGDTVYVSKNPLSPTSVNTHIPALRSREVTVNFRGLAVNIPDPNLRAAIEAELGKAPGDTITTDDMANLTRLSALPATISDLTGLEAATNLTELFLADNSISDISPLKGLTNLTELFLADSSISDISPLAGLTNLTELSLGGNSIFDISPLAGLTNLTELFLADNSISDISPLAGLNNLTQLFLANNSISDISPLAGLNNLTRLSLDYNPISDISALSGLINLIWLSLLGNSISDLSPLVANTGLGQGDAIIVNGNPLNNAAINTHIPALQRRGVRVDFDDLDLTPVDIPDSNLRTAIEKALGKASGVTITTEDMKSLYELEAPNASITDLTGLEHATNLTLLNLSDNSISDISPLAGLNNLAELYLSDNSISDISPLAGLNNLIWLELHNNSISDLSPLKGLNNPLWLELSDNSISDISPLAGLTSLIILGLSGNSISDISPVAGLINLIELSLENNSISDISPLVANAGLGSGDTVSVSENPLNHASINTHIPALQSRGVEVYFDALEPATPEYLLSIPAGISLIHVPLKVTEVDGVAQTIESVADLYDALGGTSAVNFLITYDSQAQEWRSYFGASDKGRPADRTLTDDMGIIAGMIAPASISLSGSPLGTNGSGTITINPGLNLVGLPLRDSRITRVSDLFALDGIGGNVPVIILTDGGEFKAVGRADDPGDIPIVGGQAFILTAQRAETVALSGDGWTNISGTAAAPSMALTGIEVGDITPVLGLRGAVVDEGTGVNQVGLRVTVKNLSTRRAVAAVTAPAEAGYRLTVVDIETGRAATIGDTLEISAQSPNPFIGVEPLRYTVTAEDVKQSLIQLPELVVYEIPAETQLLVNYPNPFNPETWIPYRLAEDAFVTLTIYDQTGQIVRTLDVGHQIAAVYENRSKAIYWDGRNQVGEQVASGVYFYHLSAGDYSATRKMLILK